MTILHNGFTTVLLAQNKLMSRNDEKPWMSTGIRKEREAASEGGVAAVVTKLPERRVVPCACQSLPYLTYKHFAIYGQAEN